MKSATIKLICIAIFLMNCSSGDSNSVSNTDPDPDPIPENSVTDQSCLIEEIRFATSKFEYIYNNNDELQQIINTYNGNSTAYYVNKITNDSITIGQILDDLSQSSPLISAKYNGEKLTQLKRFYTSSSINVFIFEYTQGKITVRQDYATGISYQNVYYGDYFLDQNGNVTSVKFYEYDHNAPNNFSLINEFDYTYDNGNNPWKGIIYPTFLCQYLPNAMLFSQNNILTETNNNTSNTTYYGYEYDEHNLTIKGLNKHPYNVCNSETILNEFYLYTDCYEY